MPMFYLEWIFLISRQTHFPSHLQTHTLLYQQIDTFFLMMGDYTADLWNFLREHVSLLNDITGQQLSRHKLPFHVFGAYRPEISSNMLVTNELHQSATVRHVAYTMHQERASATSYHQCMHMCIMYRFACTVCAADFLHRCRLHKFTA